MVKIQNLTFLYKNFPPIFEDFNWHIKKGESWSVLGASGSGKTTLLHLLSSLKYPDSGSIEIKGESLLRPRPETGLILQNHGLLPWASIKKNIELGFRIRRFYGPDGRHSPSNFKSDKNHEKILTRKWMKKMGIDELKDRYPHEISGGQQQRTAIARTLILNPDLLLMDEPFSALDSPTRRSLQNLILDLNSEKQYSRILVTHNIEEALILGEKILILRGLSKEDIILENPSYRKKGYRDSSAFEVLFQKIQSILGEDFG